MQSKAETFRQAEARFERTEPFRRSFDRLAHIWKDGRCRYCDKAHNQLRVGERCEARTE